MIANVSSPACRKLLLLRHPGRGGNPTNHHALLQKKNPMLIREMIRNVYKECKGVPKGSCLTKEQRLSLQMDEFMNRRYEFRYNTQIGEVEYRERFSFQFYFHPIDKRAQNSIMLDAQSEGIGVWDRDIDRYLHSNRVPIYNPLEEFLFHLPHWDGKDRIHALANRVPCKIRIGNCFSTVGS